MAVSKLYRTCGQTLLPVIMFNYYKKIYIIMFVKEMVIKYV